MHRVACVTGFSLRFLRNGRCRPFRQRALAMLRTVTLERLQLNGNRPQLSALTAGIDATVQGALKATTPGPLFNIADIRL